ncbi:2-hydroxyacid dehydrogenase [Arvimicrobium flavum]|uniref:2-hydroxyacid dehydrogenase n=1 Tax=Arvimicrobium flavum TaxID=3393320 RepID=UPI00237ABA4C|nr:2-hydroxyacid dehydrogenase [Mesorhizobium shangrilense]
MSIHILQTHPLHESCETALAERFIVHKLYEATDRDRLLTDTGKLIRAIAGGQVSAGLMDRLPNLEIIANFGVGYDSIDVRAAAARKVTVTNTPDVLNDGMAEITIGLMIALARRIPQTDRYVREGRWPAGNFPLTHELRGRTLGIVGLGRIGKEIALRAQAMKMRVVYHGRNRQDHQPYVFYSSLLDMARDADWLVVVIPGGAGTDKLVSRAVLEALGPDGMLVNVARGTVVDQEALVELLQSGGVGGAALDVFEAEPTVPQALWEMENVVLSPHQGSATYETRDAMGALVVANLDAHFAGRSPLTPVT